MRAFRFLVVTLSWLHWGRELSLNDRKCINLAFLQPGVLPCPRSQWWPSQAPGIGFDRPSMVPGRGAPANFAPPNLLAFGFNFWNRR